MNPVKPLSDMPFKRDENESQASLQPGDNQSGKSLFTEVRRNSKVKKK